MKADLPRPRAVPTTQPRYSLATFLKGGQGTESQAVLIQCQICNLHAWNWDNRTNSPPRPIDPQPTSPPQPSPFREDLQTEPALCNQGTAAAPTPGSPPADGGYERAVQSHSHAWGTSGQWRGRQRRETSAQRISRSCWQSGLFRRLTGVRTASPDQRSQHIRLAPGGGRQIRRWVTRWHWARWSLSWPASAPAGCSHLAP